MNDNAVEVAKELIRSYGQSLLDDPDRLGQFLEERCSDSRREIFLLTFALREIARKGDPYTDLATPEGRGSWEQKLRENLGFSRESAEWVVGAIAAITGVEYDADGGLEARRGAIPEIAGGFGRRPRTAPMRKKALQNGMMLLVILGVFLALFFRIEAARHPGADEFQIAFLAHLSGPGASAAQVRLKAAQAAASQVNVLGGIGGRAIHISAYDVPRDPRGAELTVRDKLKERRILAMISTCGDEVSSAIARIADEEELPVIFTESEATMVAPDRPMLYAFRINIDNAYRGKAMAYFIVQALGNLPVALVHDPGDPAGAEMARSFTAAMRAYGGKVVAETPYSEAEGIAVKGAVRVASGDARIAVIANADASGVGVVARRIRLAGFEGPIVAGVYDESMREEAGDALDRSWWIVQAADGDSQLRSFQRSYSDKYGEACPARDLTGAVLAYDTVRWMADAFARAPGYQGEALRHTLLSTRNLALSHATLTIDPRTHGPWNKALSVIYCSGGKAKFQKRFRIK